MPTVVIAGDYTRFGYRGGALVPTLSLCALAYLLGGIPFAYLAVRLLLREDVRRHGSGNVGATNAARLFPARFRFAAFLCLFALDAAKGAAAVLLLPRLPGTPATAAALAALFVVLGHTFSPYLRFRGGKGVATTLGAVASLEPVATAIALLVFAAVFALTRVVGAGSLALAATLPVAVYVRGAAPPGVGPLTILLSALIIVRHRTNLAALLRRESA